MTHHLSNTCLLAKLELDSMSVVSMATGQGASEIKKLTHWYDKLYFGLFGWRSRLLEFSSLLISIL